MVAQETNTHSVKLNIPKTDNQHFTEDKRNSPRISFDEAQAIVNNVITHINTGRGRVWSKLTAA